MRHRMGGLIALLAGGVASGFWTSAGAQDVRLPLKTQRTYEARVAEAPDRVNPAAIWHWGVERGYDAVGFFVDPGDPTKGSRFVSFDTGQRKAVVLTDDMNALVEQAVPGGLGQRVVAAREAGRLVGTGPAPGREGPFAGSHVLRGDVDMGTVGDGMVVAAFEPFWQGTVAHGGVRYERACLAVVRSADGRTYAIIAVPDPLPLRPRRGEAAPEVPDAQKHLVPLGIEGGKELLGLFVAGNTLYYPLPNGEWMSRALGQDAAPVPADPARMSAAREQGRTPPCPLFPTEAWADQPAGAAWPEADSWTRRLRPNENPDIVNAGGLQGGYFVRAVEGQGGQPAHLLCTLPGRKETVDLGPLAPCEGQTLTRVDRLRILDSGDIVVLASNDRISAVQIYQSPIMDTASAQLLAVLEAERVRRGDKKAVVPLVRSLYDFHENADRTFGSIMVASDGRFYFGVMPHHPVDGAPFFCYDPKTGELKHFGELDALAKVKGPGLIPNMMHEKPVELNGRLYLVGQDPFYGAHTFPGMTPENTRYAGSPLLMYDLKSGEFTPLGIPIPSTLPNLPRVMGGQSVFHMAADPAKNRLYFRLGYSGGEWWAANVGPDGRLTEAPAPIAEGETVPQPPVSEDLRTLRRLAGRGTGPAVVHGGRGYVFLRETRYPFETVTLRVFDLKAEQELASGKLVDDRGRYFYQVTDAVVDANGTLAISAEIWGAPGDNYNRRYRGSRPGRIDSCLWVVKDISTLLPE